MTDHPCPFTAGTLLALGAIAETRSTQPQAPACTETRGGGRIMSLNDRLEECSRWVAAQPSGLVTLPADAVAAALWEASDDPGHWPWELIDWVRDPDHRANSRWSQSCWDAAVPADKWDEYIRYDDPIRPQPTHDDCDGCGCPCHEGVAS